MLDDLAATGYQGFEMNYASLEYSFDDPAPMRTEFQKRGIRLIGLHGNVRFIDRALVGKEQATVNRLGNATKALGGELLILSGSGVPRGADGQLNSAVLKLRCEELNRAGAACKALGIRLCTHNHAGEVANGGQEVNAVMQGTDPDKVSMLMDVAYVHDAGLDVPAFIRKHCRRVAGMHVRDMKGGTEVDMGSGDIDFRGIAQVLRETRWSGWVILEIEKRADVSSRELVERSRQYIRQTMGI